MSEKLQKVLAEIGVGSRRNMEEVIKEGRVSVDGKRAELGDRVEGTETIRVDGEIIKTASSEKPICRVLMYNKPEGQMCTRMDPQNRPTVFDRLPPVSNGRWIYVGRLDVNTSGLLLFTTDGELSNALTHPSHEIERVYAVRVFGEVTQEHIRALTEGVELEDGPASFAKVEFVGGEGMNKWFNVTLKEGRKREVRRLWEALGFKVSRLKRIRYATVDLGKLPEGAWEELPLEKVNELRKAAGLRSEKRTVLSTEELEKNSDSRSNYLKKRQMQKAFRRYEDRTGFRRGRRNNEENGNNFGEESNSRFERKPRFSKDRGESSFRSGNRKPFGRDERSDSRRNGFVSTYGQQSKEKYIPINGLNSDNDKYGPFNSMYAGVSSHSDFGARPRRGRPANGERRRFSSNDRNDRHSRNGDFRSDRPSFRRNRDDEGRVSYDGERRPRRDDTRFEHAEERRSNSRGFRGGRNSEQGFEGKKRFRDGFSKPNFHKQSFRRNSNRSFRREEGQEGTTDF